MQIEVEQRGGLLRVARERRLVLEERLAERVLARVRRWVRLQERREVRLERRRRARDGRGLVRRSGRAEERLRGGVHRAPVVERRI